MASTINNKYEQYILCFAIKMASTINNNKYEQ